MSHADGGCTSWLTCLGLRVWFVCFLVTLLGQIYVRYEITLADPLDFLQPEHMQTFSEQLAQILPGRDLYSWNYSAGQDKVVVNGCPDKQDDLATLGTVVVTRSYIGD